MIFSYLLIGLIKAEETYLGSPDITTGPPPQIPVCVLMERSSGLHELK